jgi:hypothetical protein
VNDVPLSPLLFHLCSIQGMLGGKLDTKSKDRMTRHDKTSNAPSTLRTIQPHLPSLPPSLDYVYPWCKNMKLTSSLLLRHYLPPSLLPSLPSPLPPFIRSALLFGGF